MLRTENAIVAAAVAGSMIHVSSLSSLNNVAAALGAFDMLTMLSPGSEFGELNGFTPERHLNLTFHDTSELCSDLIVPDSNIVQAILDFGRGATPERPMLIHCWAGISRSSAAAFMLACECNPGCEREIAQDLRRRAPFATPNRLMVALADDLLGRKGHMVDAIERIGRGRDALQGTPYQLPLSYR